MNLSINKRTVNEFLITIFVGICVIFPADIHGAKKVFFILICLFNMKLICKSLLNKKNGMITFFAFVYPTTLFIYSTILTNEVSSSFSRVFTVYMFLIIFPIIHYEIDYEKVLVKSIYIIMFITIMLAFLDLIGVINVNTGFFRENIMYGYDLGVMGKSSEYPFYYKIFFKTSPLIVILLFKYFNMRKYINTLLCMTALVISGTRANVLFPIFFLCFFYVFYSQRNSRILKFTFVFVSILLMIFYSAHLIEIYNNIFVVKGESSDIVRQGHILGIIQLINNDPWIILRGSGMGSYFYSYGVYEYVNSVEWSYIDLWRQMGAIFFFIFSIFLLIPLFHKNKSGVYKKTAYISYLCIAATNPLLFSSTAYMLYIYMYYDIEKGDNNEISKYSIGNI